MNLIWDDPEIQADEICKIMKKQKKWPEKLTRKIIKKLIWKKYIKRSLWSGTYKILIGREEGLENQKPQTYVDTYIDCCDNKILKQIRKFRRWVKNTFEDVDIV